MKLPTVGEMFALGVHLGHKKEYTHPKAKKYIFGIRNKIYIIDLEKTLEVLQTTLEFIKKEAKDGKVILFVGTKRQLGGLIKVASNKCGMPFVAKRWYGGTITNYETIRKSLKQLESFEAQMKSEEFANFTKKERSRIKKERDRLYNSLEGLVELKGLPDYLFVVDCAKEKVAILEATKAGIPVIGICDTNANPDLIAWPIPANDDAAKSLELIVNLVSEAILEGKEKK